MERRTFVAGAAWLASALLVACGGSKKDAVEEADEAQTPTEPEPADEPTEEAVPPQEPDQPQMEEEPDVEENDRMRIQVTINGTPFLATLEEGQAAEDLLGLLPVTLHMEELHGNEKYSYLDSDFGGESYVPTVIEAGDLMVYGGNCLVLFYKTFDNPGYAYQYVGRIDDTSTLAEVCGSNSVMVDFAQRS